MSDLRLVETQALEQTVVVVPPEILKPYDLQRAEMLAETVPQTITSPEECSRLDKLQRRLKAFVAEKSPIHIKFDEGVAVFYNRWKLACDMRTLFFGDLEKREKAIGRLIAAFHRKEEEERRREELRIQEEQRRAQERERNQHAKRVEKTNPEMAEAIRQTPVHVPAIAVATRVPDAVTENRTTRKVYKWRPAGCLPHLGVKDKQARKKAAALVPREYLDLDDTALNEYAKRMQGTGKLPGIEFYDEDDSNVRV